MHTRWHSSNSISITPPSRSWAAPPPTIRKSTSFSGRRQRASRTSESRTLLHITQTDRDDMPRKAKRREGFQPREAATIAARVNFERPLTLKSIDADPEIFKKEFN